MTHPAACLCPACGARRAAALASPPTLDADGYRAAVAAMEAAPTAAALLAAVARALAAAGPGTSRALREQAVRVARVRGWAP